MKTLETSDSSDARRRWLVRLVKGLYSRGYGADQVRQLYRLVDGMMTLPQPMAELAWKEIHEFEQENNMPYITTAERVGIEKGLALGREEGLLAGIEVALRIKFGESALALMEEIQRIENVAQLQVVLDRIAQVDSPAALRHIWSQSP